MKLTKLFALVAALMLILAVPAFAIGYVDVVPENSYWTEENMAYINGLPNAAVVLYKRGEEGSTSVATYFPGVIVEKISEENGFVKVKIGGSTGYLRTADLTDASPCNPPLTLTATEDVELFNGVANTSKTIATYSSNTMLTVLGVRSDGWVHVLVEGQVGFVKSGKLSPTPIYGEFFAGVTENNKGETVSASAPDEAVICCPNSNDTLTLRKRADITAPSIGEYYNGTVVKLLEEPKNGWVKVKIAGQATGYVQTSYLAMDGQNVTVCHRQMVVDNKSGNGLNMRTEPETDGKKVDYCANGEIVTVIGQWYNDWYHVYYEGQYGYVLDRLSEIE